MNFFRLCFVFASLIGYLLHIHCRGAQRLLSQLELSHTVPPRSPSPYSSPSTNSSFLSLVSSPSTSPISLSSSSLSSFKSSIAFPSKGEEIPPSRHSPAVDVIFSRSGNSSPCKSPSYMDRYAILREARSDSMSGDDESRVPKKDTFTLCQETDEKDDSGKIILKVSRFVDTVSIEREIPPQSTSSNSSSSKSRKMTAEQSKNNAIRSGSKVDDSPSDVNEKNKVISTSVDTEKKRKNKNLKNSNNKISGKRNASPPKIYNYRDNPKYFFYSYTGDSSTEIPLAKLANSKSNSSLKSVASSRQSSSVNKSITKSASSKSLSSKSAPKTSGAMTKSSSSYSRLSSNRQRSTAVSKANCSMKSSSSSKSIASNASTSSAGSSFSVKSTSSNSSNSTSSFKSASSSQSCKRSNSTSRAKSASSSGVSLKSSCSSCKSSTKSKPASSKSNAFSSKYEALTKASSSSQKSNSLYNCAPTSLKFDNLFSKSPSPTYNSLDSNSSSKYDTLSSKSSREASLSRDADLSSCSSSSASTATIRSYRSLLPASLRGSSESYKSSKEKSNQKDKVRAGEPLASTSKNKIPDDTNRRVKNSSNKKVSSKPNERCISVGKDMLEKALRSGRNKSTKIGKGIKGVRWKEEEELKENNNNTPAKNSKQSNECDKTEGITKIQSKIFSGRQYYRMK